MERLQMSGNLQAQVIGRLKKNLAEQNSLVLLSWYKHGAGGFLFTYAHQDEEENQAWTEGRGTMG